MIGLYIFESGISFLFNCTYTCILYAFYFLYVLLSLFFAYITPCFIDILTYVGISLIKAQLYLGNELINALINLIHLLESFIISLALKMWVSIVDFLIGLFENCEMILIFAMIPIIFLFFSNAYTIAEIQRKKKEDAIPECVICLEKLKKKDDLKALPCFKG